MKLSFLKKLVKEKKYKTLTKEQQEKLNLIMGSHLSEIMHGSLEEMNKKVWDAMYDLFQYGLNYKTNWDAW